MRARQENSSPPADQTSAVVEAFLDGERVDPASLKEALATAEARDHFVDLLLLRDAMGDLAPMARMSRPSGRSAACARSGSRRPRQRCSSACPLAMRQDRRVVAPAVDPPNVEVVLPMERPISAPAPTRSIAFEPGVNWTDSTGGK